MGSRDYRKREPKKPGKNVKRISETTVVAPPTMVEVVKKGKKAKGEEAQEEEG